ncbi:MAG: PAS domain S-box protein [Rhodoferax sp.]
MLKWPGRKAWAQRAKRATAFAAQQVRLRSAGTLGGLCGLGASRAHALEDAAGNALHAAPQTFESVLLLLASGLVVALSGLLVVLWRTNQRLRQQESALKPTQQTRHFAQYRDVVHASLDGFWITDAQARILDVNLAMCNLLGYTRDELLQLNIRDIEADESPEETATHVREIAERGHTQFEARHRRKDGRIINVAVSVLHLPDLGDRFFAFVHDITDRRESELQLRIAATAFEAQEGILVTNADNVILRVNHAFTQMTGYSAEEAIGKTPSLIKSGRHDQAFYAQMWDSLQHHGTWQGEVWNRRKSGESYPEWLSLSAVRDEHGAITHFVGTMTDITQRKIAEDEIHSLAFYDPLTRLPNRRLMLDRLRQSLTSSERHQRNGALMMIDLDNFKTLNDTQGHAVGDLLLVAVAQRIHSGIREGDTVARLGGDEFVVILEDLDRAVMAVMQAETVAQKVQNLLS